MHCKKNRYLDDLHGMVSELQRNFLQCYSMLLGMESLIIDKKFEGDEEPEECEGSKYVFMSGALPATLQFLTSAIEKLPDFISVKNMVDAGIYSNKSTLNKKLREKLIPSELYMEAGKRKFFIKEKLLEYINEHYA